MIPPWLLNLANGRNVTIAFVLWLAYSLLLFNTGPYPSLQATVDGPLLEARFGYSQADASEQFRILEEDGRDTYRNFQLLDLLNAVLTATTLTLLLAFALSRLFAAGNPVGLLVFLPILGGILELLENALLLLLVSAFPSEATWASSIASPVTSLKLVISFTALPATLLSLAALGLKTVLNRWKATRSGQ